MEEMKTKLCIITALLAIPAFMQAQTGVADPQGALVYALPMTSVKLEIEASQENFYAGPYAKYAQKYLGIDARQKDAVTFTVTSARMTPSVEADMSARYTVNPGAAMPAFLTLTSQGLVSVSSSASEETVWRFPAAGKADFSGRGVTSNLTSEAATLYRNVKNESSYNKVAVQQEMVVQKSPDARAKEAAEMIFNLRKKRVQIITGDTDATFSGEALNAAIEEISRLEKEYMSLFTGYSEYSLQKMNYEVVPSKDNENQIYVAFRISDSKGLVPADDLSGKPYLLEFVYEPVAAPAGKQSASGGTLAHYRVPASCNVRLSDGVNVLLQSRMPVYQLGIESTFPLKSK